ACEIRLGASANANTRRTACHPLYPMPTTTGGVRYRTNGRRCRSAQALTQLDRTALFIAPSLMQRMELVRNTGVIRSHAGGRITLKPAASSSFRRLSLVLLLGSSCP